MSLFQRENPRYIGENKHSNIEFSELQYVVHRRPSMVPPLHEKRNSAEVKKKVSTGEETCSSRKLLESCYREFIELVMSFEWFEKYQEHMRDFKNNKIDAACLVEKMEEMFEGRPELIAGFNEFLPETYRITTPTPKPKPKLRIVCEKRKRNDDGASDSDNGVAKDAKIRKVIRVENTTKMFREEDEVDDGNNDIFLGHEAPTVLPRPRHPKIRVLPNKAMPEEDRPTERAIAFVNKVVERFRNNNGDSSDEDEAAEAYVEFFLEIFCKRNKSSPDSSSVSDKEELNMYKEVATLFAGHSDLIEEFQHFLTEVPRLDSLVNFYNCKQCTPSYRLLPKNVPVPACTKRSELASEVLNDRWICVVGVDTSDSTTATSSTLRGGGGRKTRKIRKIRKSRYEKDLMDWEDEKYEHDMLEEYVKSTSKNIERLLKKIKEESPTEVYIEEHLSEMNLRCIKRMYELETAQMMDLLMDPENNIRRVLRVILRRLQQKQEELKQERSDIKQKWAHLFPEERRRR